MKRITNLLLSLVFVFTGVAASVVPASAAGGGSSGLGIQPRKNYVINPGETKTDKLTINNLDGNEPLNVTLRVVDFTFMNESGSPRLDLSADAKTTTWSLKPFIKLPGSFVVPAGGRKTVDITVSIPKTQGAGSYYSAIQYLTGGADGGQVNLSASGVTLAFVSVPGTVKEKLTLTKLGAFQSDGAGLGKYLFINTSNAPGEVAYTLKNDGNVTENPTGTITIKPSFFGKSYTIDEINPNTSLALIGQNRLFSTCIEKEDKVVELQGEKSISQVCKKYPKMLPGRYTITLDAFYGQNGNSTQEITGTATFWYLPFWFLIGVVVVIAAIAFFIWKLVRKIKAAKTGTGYRAGARRRR
jgi:hypothetical protein